MLIIPAMLMAMALMVACGESGSDLSCEKGTAYCTCDSGQCDEGLMCSSNICVECLTADCKPVEDGDVDTVDEPEQEVAPDGDADEPAEEEVVTEEEVEEPVDGDVDDPAEEEIVVTKYTCVECHSSKTLIKEDIERRGTDHVYEASSGGCGGAVSRLEPSQAVLVRDAFLESTHGRFGCVYCHGGVEPAANRDEAHVDNFTVHVDTAKCESCHRTAVENHPKSLHSKFNHLTYEDQEFIDRAAAHERRVTNDPHKKALMAQGIDQACGDCHRTTCGSCHIVMPEPAHGGFPNSGHVFYKKPNPVYNCTACHGSRKSKEFLLSEVDTELVNASDLGPMELKEDVHYNQHGMSCADCHDSKWMHENDEQMNYKLRYENDYLVRCEDCHVNGKEQQFADASMHHQIHGDPDGNAPHLQCQVCHSQAYPNCLSCHVSPTDTTEPPADYKFYTLKIAKNPYKNVDYYTQEIPALAEKFPYDYSLVRRPPIVYDIFEEFEPGILDNFALYPTWKYATPHNIQKNTPQTANGCQGCHDDDRLYMTEAYLESLVIPDNVGLQADIYLEKEKEANATILIQRTQ